jgi:hypothetical protein
MTRSRLFVLILFMLPVVHVAAQTAPAAPGSAAPVSPPRAHVGGCWQQVGVPPSIAREGRELERRTHSQVMAVCQDPSLSAQQKREQIHQLREQAIEQVKGLVTEQQAEAYKNCMAEGHGERAGRAGWPCASRPEGGMQNSPSAQGQASAGSTASQER